MNTTVFDRANGARPTRIAIIGYGHTGKAAYEAVEAAPDLTAAGVVLRDKSTAPQKGVPAGVPVAEDIGGLGKVDAAILCTPSRVMPDMTAKLLARGIHTVDSFDMHGSIYDVKTALDPIAKANNAVAIIAAGWDPGSDSVIRALLEAMAPRGLTYTNFGPGMSMGHTVTVKAMEGVKDALSVTIPLGTGLHRRMVYVVPAEGADAEAIKKRVMADPSVSHDDTHVIFVKNVTALTDKGHGVKLERKAASGVTDNQLFTFSMTAQNPALTGQVLASAARAAARQKAGCYTMIEIPVIDLLPGDREEIIRRIV
jgi:diaminopimelate dehydrogenase